MCAKSNTERPCCNSIDSVRLAGGSVQCGPRVTTNFVSDVIFAMGIFVVGRTAADELPAWCTQMFTYSNRSTPLRKRRLKNRAAATFASSERVCLRVCMHIFRPFWILIYRKRININYAHCLCECEVLLLFFSFVVFLGAATAKMGIKRNGRHHSLAGGQRAWAGDCATISIQLNTFMLQPVYISTEDNEWHATRDLNNIRREFEEHRINNSKANRSAHMEWTWMHE